MNTSLRALLAICLVIPGFAARAAITLMPPFHTNYLAIDLGSVTGLPPNYGPLTFKRGDPQTLIIGGGANLSGGKFYSVPVIRGTNQHIIGFGTNVVFFADGMNNDGGIAYGPNSVLFYTRYPLHQIGEIRLGSTNTDKIIGLATNGITSSVGGLNFVPEGYPGAGRLVISSYNGGAFFSTTITNDGTGLYNIASVIAGDNGFSGPEGFIYVPSGSPQFTNQNMLINEYISGRVSAVVADTNGLPLASTRRDFITGLTGAEGAVIDPLTGDFLFSTYGGGSRIVEVQGFGIPLPADIETLVNLSSNALPCDGQTLSILLTNHGPARATGLFLSETLPPNAVLLTSDFDHGTVDVSSNVLSWSIGFLPPQSSASLSLQFYFNAPGLVTNSIIASANEGDSNPTNNVVLTPIQIDPIPVQTLLSSRYPGGSINICWNSSNTGFVLQATTNLTPPSNWLPVSGAISNNGTVQNYYLTNAGPEPEKYFRLFKP